MSTAVRYEPGGSGGGVPSAVHCGVGTRDCPPGTTHIAACVDTVTENRLTPGRRRSDGGHATAGWAKAAGPWDS